MYKRQTNCGTDVEISGITDTNHVYAGGLYGMDNRVTTFNCYALGNVTGNSTNNNKVHLGGLVGQGGGIHYNCYAAGDIISLKSTSDAGALNGRSAGINIDYNCYYNTEAVVKQGDIQENKAIGVVSDAEIEDACKQACADEFIERFPDKYQTHIEQGGNNVSGGQKQRLCIARALLKKPRILILDDSTCLLYTSDAADEL